PDHQSCPCPPVRGAASRRLYYDHTPIVVAGLARVHQQTGNPAPAAAGAARGPGGSPVLRRIPPSSARSRIPDRDASPVAEPVQATAYPASAGWTDAPAAPMA